MATIISQLPMQEMRLLQIVAGVVCLVTGLLAWRKGYSFFLWILAGGVIGLAVLAFLPFVNKKTTSKEEREEQKGSRWFGNIIGAIISAATIAVLWIRLSRGNT